MTTRASKLSLLGGFLFTVDGERRDLPARKVKALMCRLAFDEEPLSRDQLSALLWPDSAPSAALHSLRQALSDLRRTLQGSAIGLTVTPREAALETYGGTIDVREFRRLAAEDDPDGWRRAMDLYRGSLLEGLDVPVDLFEEWLDHTRRELAQTALSLCRALAEHHDDHVEEAIRWNRRLLTLDPLDEAAHRDLMRLYIVAGQDGAAIRQYLHCRSVLERDLGIAPEAETAALYESLLGHRAASAPGALAAPAPPSARPSTSPRWHQGEPDPPPSPRRLRPAVVLTCRLAVDPSDPERADAEGHRQLEQITAVVRSYGGRVVAHLGGRIVCGFGLNRVRGTEADRAWLAAAELTAGLTGLRSGIASGQVIYRHEEGSLVGQAAVDAEELAAEAAPGEVRLSDAVAAARRYGARPLGPEAGKLTGGAAGAETAPLVGRAMEIRQFVAVLDSSRDGGYGCAMLLRGEAGIGKTRLVQEYTALAARESLAVHAGQAFDFGAARGQDAMGQLVRSLLGRDAASADAIAKRLDSSYAPYLGAILGLEPAAAMAEELDNLSPLERLRRTTEAVVALVRLSARDDALVLVVDDLHWADRLTLAVLPRLARVAAELPVVLVMTSRVWGEALDPEWRAAMGGAPLITLDLRPLRRDDAGRLACAMGAGGDRLAEMLDRAGGNPLFIQQLVRSAGLGPGLPHSIQSLAVAQLEALPEEVQSSVRAASVLGQQFTTQALTATGGAPGELDAAVQAGLITPGEGEWRFRHALIRDGIYENVLASQRRELHGRAAAHFCERSLSLHAQHLDLAESPDAVAALVAAAADEIEHYRLSPARELVQRALAREPRNPRAMLIDAQLELMVGNTARAATGFRACHQQAQADGVRAQALVGLGMALNQMDDYGGAAEALGEAVALDVDDHGHQADAWLQLGNVLFPQGLTEQCLRAHRASLEHASRAGSTLRQARAEGGLGDAYYQQGAMLTAFRHFDRCVQLGESHDHPSVVPANLAMRGLTRMYQNDLRQALSDGERALALARQSSNLRHQVLAHSVISGVETFHGDVEPGMIHARQTLELGERIGSRRFAVDGRTQMAHLLWNAGRRDEARRALEAAGQVLDDSMLPFAGAYVRALQAACALSAGERRSRLAEGERLLDAHAVSHCHFYFYVVAIEACLTAGESGEALRYAAALSEYTAREPLPFADFFIRRARALTGTMTDQERGELIGEARAAELRVGLRLLEPDPLPHD